MLGRLRTSVKVASSQRSFATSHRSPTEKDVAKVRQFLDEHFKKSGFSSLSEWYAEDASIFRNSAALKPFDGNVSRALQYAYPHHSWHAWKFPKCPTDFWESKDNVKSFMSVVATENKVEVMDDWYKLSSEDIRNAGGGSLLNKYGSLQQILLVTHPFHPWKPWRFGSVPSGFWDIPDNRSDFFDWIAKELGFMDKQDWYKVTWSQLRQCGAHNILKTRYSSSIAQALQSIYNLHRWDVTQFELAEVSSAYDDPAKHKELLERIASRRDITSLDKWYNATRSLLVETGLLGWLDRNYEGSLTKALQAVYPDHKWEPWQFAKVEDGFWDSIENQREFLASLHTPLGIFELAQWYRVTAHELKANGGRGLLQRYNGSMRDMLLATYPRHPWQEWRFLYKTTGNDTPVEAEDTRRHHLQGFMDNLAVKLSLKELDDWYRVSQKELSTAGASHVLARFGGLLPSLRSAYSEHTWVASKFLLQSKKSIQRQLIVLLSELFPETEIIEEYNLGASFKMSKKKMIFDAFIPSMNLLFEYAGEQHYKDLQKFGQASRKHENDIEKMGICMKRGITLIDIPYWVNLDRPVLAGMIKQARPELLPGEPTREMDPQPAVLLL